MEVSYSRIKTWRFCRQAHYYKYVEKIERKRKSVALVRGTIIHDMIRSYLSGENWEPVLDEHLKQYHRLFIEEQEEYGDLPEELPRLMKGYVEKWKNDPLEYVEIEFDPGLIPLAEGIDLTLRVDAIAKDSRGRLWLVEHKTHKQFPKEDVRFSDYQTLIYIWALGQVGYKIEGILWDYIRTKVPTKPRVLKNGKLSVAKNIDTDHQTYLDTINEVGLDPSDYQDILGSLKMQEEKFYRRVRVPVNHRALAQMVREFKRSAIEIEKLQDTPIRNMNYFQCGNCEYYPICSAELLGLDTEFILRAEYKGRKK